MSDHQGAELKPCPFCGNKARYAYGNDGEIVNVRCVYWGRGCMGAGANKCHETDAAAAWNRRPAPASDLRAAAQAVVDRWDSPQWKDQPHTAEFINRLRRALEAPAGGDGLPELPQHIAHLHYNGDMCWDTNHQIDVWPVDVYTADQMRQYARDALAAAKDRQALNDKQIMRGWLDWTEPGCSATDAFVAGVRFTEKHHGVAPPSDSAAEGGGENAGSKEQ